MSNELAKSLIKQFEGGPFLKAYRDPVGIPTIGWGSVRHPSGTPVQIGDVISAADAEAYLDHEIGKVADAVDRLVTVPLTPGQRAAVLDFAFNCGEGALAQSTLLRKLNRGDYLGACREFAKWNRAGGVVLPGLVRRRQAEADLFQSQHPKSPEQQATHPYSSEAPMPFPFLIPAVTAAVELAPALGKLFGSGSEVSERNIKAAEKVVEVMKQVSGADTGEGAAKTLAADPAKAAEFREAVHVNMGDFLAALKDAQEADDASADKATERAIKLSAATGGRWLYLLGGVACAVVAASYAITAGVLFKASSFSDETKALLLGQVVIFGFVTVLGFLFGSNIQNRIADEKSREH